MSQHWRSASLAVAFLVAQLTLPATGAANTLFWEGDLGGAWSNGIVGVNTNWTDGVNQVKPQDGDILIFPGGAMSANNFNDIAGLDLLALQINGVPAGGNSYFISGEPITLNSSAGVTFNTPRGPNEDGPAFFVPITLNTSLTIRQIHPEQFSGARIGALNLNGFTLTFDVGPGGFNAIVLNGVISGDGQILKQGAGDIAFDNNNTYTGVTHLIEGAIRPRSNISALGAIGPGNETIQDAGTTITAESSNVTGESFVLNGSGIDGILGALRAPFPQQFSTFTGPITLGSDVMIVAEGDIAHPLTLSGPIAGDSDSDLILSPFNEGYLVLTGTNTYSGQTRLQSGFLVVNGTQPASPVIVTGGTLNGTGTVGPVTATGGTISPGLSPGILSSSSVSFAAGVSFAVELNGPVVGVDYDQLNVSGTVSLNGATLTATLGFAPTSATSFTIIANDTSDPVVGTFTGLGEGATFLLGTTAATITYQGGDGNDVVLSVGPFLSHFAEGATFTNDGLDFEVELAVLNPGALDADVTLRFLKTDGTTVVMPLAVPGMSRRTVTVSAIAGLENAEFSTAIEANVPVTVERTMTWVGSGAGAHAETAVNAPALEWYLAEGATHSGFSLFYLIANANAAAASIDVTYLLPSPAPPLTKNYIVPGNTRSTIWVNVEDALLASTDVSAVVRSLNGVAVVVERAMYLDRPNEKFVAGHASAGLAAPSLTWHLAEGATGSFFDSFVLLANPTLLDATVTVRYLGPLGQIVSRNYLVTAQSRRTVWVDFDHPLLADTAFAATVTSDVPILVERAMWWPEPHEARYEAHNSAGVTALNTRWTVADASTGGASDAESYLLIGNSSASAATVQVTLVFEDGTSPAQKTYAVLPASRFNVSIVDEFPAAVGRRVAAIVDSLQPNANTAATPLVVERSTYSDVGGVVWENGVNTLATRPR